MKNSNQKGVALIIFTVIFALVATAFLVSQLNASDLKIMRDKKTAVALAEAKAALIGSVTSVINIATPSYLPNPDLKLGASIEGSQTLSSGSVDISLIGKLPWRDLGVAPLKDGWNECLWYAVSGRFKNFPITPVFNWDTQGQITVIDVNGNVIASDLVALIISPGALLPAQDRLIAAIDTPQCGGNYDARNYLDSYSIGNAIAGEVNYFVGSTNNREAPNTNEKRFVLAKNDFYNDQFAFVTTDEIFRPLIRRSDFAIQITSLLNDPDFISIANEITITTAATSPSDPKGTGHLGLNCECAMPYCISNKSITNVNNRIFCKNWKEMLLITELTVPSPIVIDGMPTANCSRVLIFGGQKINTQVRLTAANKTNPANYLEGANLIAFNTLNDDFNGASAFDAANSSMDILRCL